ncbi:MAG TPA: rhamnan synthesis F family protein [Candidatus Cryosericum sp.]|nr:rhamnan synthesis F family protein [Candidatus Cryosericum sp.]
MQENNAIKRLFHSLSKVGAKATILKTVSFFRSYLPKSPVERMLMLRYRYTVDPLELEEPVFASPEYQEDIDFSGMRADVQAVAFFDLSAMLLGSEADLAEEFERAASAAKAHGLYGFCFYWRSSADTRVLDVLQRHAQIPLRYCLCRVREQSGGAPAEEEAFQKALLSCFSDPRYLRAERKPLILSLDQQAHPAGKPAFDAWRQYAKAHGAGELQIWACRTDSNPNRSERASRGADAEVEFPPLDQPKRLRVLEDSAGARKFRRPYHYGKLSVYRKVLAHAQMLEGEALAGGARPLYRTCTMTWNKPAFHTRRKPGFSSFSARFFYNWLISDAAFTRWRFQEESRFLFIDGWNGGPEETRLSPGELRGSTYLNTLSKALFGLPFCDDFRVITEQHTAQLQFDDSGSTPRICVQAHLFFLETMEELIDELNRIPFRFDCFVSTDTGVKKAQIERAFAERSRAEHVSVACYPNRGRDIAPFLQQMEPVIDNYDYILHVHGKKSTIKELGYAWREYLLRNLLGHSGYVRGVIAAFERDDRLGMIFPETFPLLSLEPVRRNERIACGRLLQRCGFTAYRFSAPAYPAGDMFWARTKAIRRLFKIGIKTTEFPRETGKPTQMLAHHIERLWVDLAANEGYGYLKTWNCCGRVQPVTNKRRIAFFVHYDKDCLLSDSDAAYMQELAEYADEIVFITNSELSAKDLNKVRSKKVRILRRGNIGFDFGAWKDAVTEYGFDRLGEFDQVIFANNSNFAPLWSLSSVFSEMERRDPVDFWGIIEYPRGFASDEMTKVYIDAHIQSYFFVTERSLTSSPAFEAYWNRVGYHASIMGVIEHEETEMTKFFTDRGFTYGVFLSESALVMEKTKNNAPYMYPRSLVLLNSPFVKKKTDMHTFPDEKIMLEETMRQIKAANMPER